jgi:hypothetical protein
MMSLHSTDAGRISEMNGFKAFTAASSTEAKSDAAQCRMTHTSRSLADAPDPPEDRTMTPEEREKINQLVRLIQDEQDPGKFTALAEQLCELLDRKERRFVEERKTHATLKPANASIARADGHVLED